MVLHQMIWWISPNHILWKLTLTGSVSTLSRDVQSETLLRLHHSPTGVHDDIIPGPCHATVMMSSCTPACKLLCLEHMYAHTAVSPD